MRFRTQSKETNERHNSIRWYKSVSSYNLSTFPDSADHIYADIWDELLPKSDHRTRNVQHISGVVRHVPLCYLEEHNSQLPDYDHHLFDTTLEAYMSGYQYDTTWTIGHRISTAIEEVANDSDKAFNSRAFQAMKPSLEGDVSLTNFILELSDFKQILRLFAPTRDITKKISEGHLTWSFAVKPMISDLTEIWNSLHNYEKRIREFLERSETPQKRYYSETDEDVETKTGDTLIRTEPEFKSYYRLESVEKIKRVATMSYTYDVEEIKTRLQKLNALRAILGLRLTPSVIWEAIPFSFVVDWFLNVGKWLESLEDDVIEPTVFISDYSVSYLVQYTVKAGWTRNATTDSFSYSQDDCYKGKLRRYVRRRVLPDTGSTPLQFSGLTPNQLALSASLINVMRR